MGFLYVTSKSVWRRVVPRSLNGFFFGGRTRLSRGLLSIKARLERGATHDELYDEGYFRRQDKIMAVESQIIATSLVEQFSPSSVIDVGCGSGAILDAFGKHDLRGIGLELAGAALDRCLEKGLDVRQFDIENDPPPAIESADLVVSTEVAEHLPETVSARYVDLLCRLARRHVVITAATPGQGGTDHVNEQPHSFWISLFENRGGRFLQKKTDHLRSTWRRANIKRGRNVLAFEMPGHSGK